MQHQSSTGRPDALLAYAVEILASIRRLPGFKVLTLVFAETSVDVEIEASGAVAPSSIDEGRVVALIRSGMVDGASLLIRQYIPGSTQGARAGADARPPAHWIALHGAILGSRKCVPIDAEALEASKPLGADVGRYVFKDFRECLLGDGTS